MVEQRAGKIVNIASLHTPRVLPGVVAYGTSKGAIGSMTRALAVEWAPSTCRSMLSVPDLSSPT